MDFKPLPFRSTLEQYQKPAADLLDMEAVVRAAGLERFTILAAGNGGIRGIQYSAFHPRRPETTARVWKRFSLSVRTRDCESSRR